MSERRGKWVRVADGWNVFLYEGRVIPDDCLRSMGRVPVLQSVPNRLKGATLLENGDVT